MEAELEVLPSIKLHRVGNNKNFNTCINVVGDATVPEFAHQMFVGHVNKCLSKAQEDYISVPIAVKILC